MSAPLITALGASAGGIQALKIFFEHAPADAGIVYVVLLHLSPAHDSRLAQVLQHATAMPVQQVTEKTRIEPDHVYVIPPDKHLVLEDGHIIPAPNQTLKEQRAPVDIFFRYLAETHGSHAIAVLLSGTGANGSIGLKRIKECGGAVFVQNPREAEFNEIPHNAIATGLVDAVLNVADIPAHILAYRDSLAHTKLPAEKEPPNADGQLRQRTGHDFANYKRAPLRLTPYRTAEDRIGGVMVSLVDITGRRKADEAIRESEEKYRTLFEAIDEGFALCELIRDEKGKGVDYRILELNPAFEAQIGAPVETFLGKTALEVFAGYDAWWIETYAQMVDSGEPVHFEHQLEQVDRWYEVSAYPRGGDRFAVIYNDITERRKSEQTVRKSEEKLSAFITATSDTVYEMSADWREMRVLEGKEFLPSIPEPTEDWLAVYIPESEQPRVRAAIAQAIETQSTFELEHRVIRMDGTEGWTYSRAIPLLNKAGGIEKWFGTASDITNRKKSQTALRETEERLRIATDSAVDYAIIGMNAEGIIESWSRGAEKTFGWTEAEAIGQYASLLFTPEDRAAGAPEAELIKAVKEGFAPDERWHIRKDGSRFFMSGVVRPIQEEKLLGFVKVARDLTEQRAAEEALREKQIRLDIAQKAARVGIWGYDLVKEQGIATPEWNELTGYPDPGETFELETFIGLVYPEDREQLWAAHQKMTQGEGMAEVEFRLQHPQRGLLWLLKRGQYIPPFGNQNAMLMGSLIDITERKLFEQQKDQFIGIASHELRTPVTSIKAYVEILAEMLSEAGDDRKSALVQKLDTQVSRLTSLIHMLLDTTRIAEGGLQLHKTAFNMDALITETAETLQPVAGKQHIELHLNAGVEVLADAERIRQVVVNLLSNAIRYAPDTDRIVVSSDVSEGQVTVCVRDFGIGIPEQAQQLIFERFFREKSSGYSSGLGLGLYISAGIVQQHGGRIWVESKPGKGALFCFTLPVEGEA